MKIGNHVHAEYDNGEIVNGEIVKVRTMVDGNTLAERILLTVKAEQGYRSIYIDKCVKFLCLEELDAKFPKMLDAYGHPY